MKLNLSITLVAAAIAGPVSAQRLPVVTSYPTALTELSKGDRAPVRGSNEGGTEQGLSTTQRRTTDYNRRIGKPVGRINKGPAKISIVRR